MIKNQQVVFLGILLLTAINCLADGPGKRRHHPKNGLFNYWKIEVSAGATSYFGDMSQYDLNPINKIAKESVPAVGLKITKSMLDDKIGVGGQLLKGGFRCDHDPARSFRTGIFEYNIQVQSNITQIMFPDHSPNPGLSVYAGIGQFLFWSYAMNEPAELDGSNLYKPGVPEFVYFVGGSLNYRINEVFSIVVDLSTRQAQNDYLDLYRHRNNYDYYSYLGVGLSIFIDDFPTRLKKKQECEAYDAINRKYPK